MLLHNGMRTCPRNLITELIWKRSKYVTFVSMEKLSCIKASKYNHGLGEISFRDHLQICVSSTCQIFFCR